MGHTQQVASKPRFKLNYVQILLIGFGFLASSLAWSIYNTQVPLLLRDRFMQSNTAIGVIMTIDNFFGVIFQPVIGAWSDGTRTRIGRRLPWIAFGIPVCAILFAIIPLQHKLPTFMAAIIAFNLVMSLWRSPVISLMPDVTPRPLRSRANGIINLMGGFGSVIAFFVGGKLSDLRDDKFYAFLMASILMILSLLVLIKFIREPDALNYKDEKGIPTKDNIQNRWAKQSRADMIATRQVLPEEVREELEEQEKQSRFAPFLALPRAMKISLFAILVAILAWFMGYNAIETFFTLFATSTYSMTDGQATMMLTGFSMSFLAFAYPAGLIGQRIGRKKTILIGLIGIVALFLPILFRPSQPLLQVLLIGGGFAWACININSLPMVVEFATDKTIGAFTGYYYLFSFTAAIVSPILYGFIQDRTHDFGLLFVYAVICFAAAFVAMMFVRHGDYETESEGV